MSKDGNLPSDGVFRIWEDSFTGGYVRFESEDQMAVVEWLVKNSPGPEPKGMMDAGFTLRLPDGKCLSGPMIDRWIHDLVCPACSQTKTKE